MRIINILKKKIMKSIKNKFLLLILTFFLGYGFYACTKDPVIVVTPKTLGEYVAQCGHFVTSELAITRSTVVGYNKGNYSVSLDAVTATKLVTVKAAYLTALVADSAIIASPTVTIPQIVSGNQDLGTPGNVFWTGINQCDKRPLNDLITAYTTYNTSVIVGTAVGNVTAAAKTTFTTAITQAKTTRDASTTTIDRQITDAIAILKSSKVTFQAAIIK